MDSYKEIPSVPLHNSFSWGNSCWETPLIALLFPRCPLVPWPEHGHCYTSTYCWVWFPPAGLLLHDFKIQKWRQRITAPAGDLTPVAQKNTTTTKHISNSGNNPANIYFMIATNAIDPHPISMWCTMEEAHDTFEPVPPADLPRHAPLCGMVPALHGFTISSPFLPQHQLCCTRCLFHVCSFPKEWEVSEQLLQILKVSEKYWTEELPLTAPRNP